MISNAAFAQLMQQINLPAAAAEYDRFALYCTQLQEWNQRMNLTAITDDEGVAEKHFADSLLPLTMVQLPVGASLVDVGSGAGFPGLPMALARPDLRVTFLDSLQKRLTFLAQLTQMLEVGYIWRNGKVSCAECTLPSPLAVSRIRLISRFSAAVSFTAAFAACCACGSGFRFLNNGFHLLFCLDLPLQGCVEIVCLVRPLFRPQEHTADDLSGYYLQGLAVPLIHGE